MNDNKNRQALRRGCALLLAAMMCITALAGCGGKAKKPTEKTQKEQAQEAAPKSDTDSGKGTQKPEAGKTDTAKTDSGKNDGAKKDAGKTDTAKKDSAPKSGTSTAKPAGKAAAPKIKTQPKNVKAALDASATFTVAVEGIEAVKYAWQLDKNDGKGWAEIPGANSARYTIEKVTKTHDGWKYRCIVSNAAGRTESDPATLNIKT